MGFGGALIALNRQEALERRRQQEARQRAVTHARAHMFGLPSFGDIIRQFTSNAPTTPPQPRQSHWWAQLLGVEDDEAGLQVAENFNLFGPFDWMPFEEVPLQAAAAVPPRTTAVSPSVWQSSYTHPDKMLPGFTSDFSESPSVSASTGHSVIILDDDSSPSTKGRVTKTDSHSPVDMTTTLVCARCLDPLVLSNDESSLPSEAARRNRRVWALRCGHMLDGKCVHELMLPPPQNEEPKVDEDTIPSLRDVKGKGKARAVSTSDSDMLIDSAVSDKKGKGKRPADHSPTIDTRPSKMPFVGASSIDSPSSLSQLLPTDIVDPPVDSIRSRLRPRRAQQDTSPGSRLSDSSQSAQPERRIRILSHRQGVSALPPIDTLLPPHSPKKSKGKRRARPPRQPKVEAYFEWQCPVAGCEKRHVSMLIRGEWKMDPNEGAIILFL